MGFKQPGYSVFSVPLLAAGQCEYEVPRWDPTTLFPSYEIGHQNRIRLLHVLGAATIEVPVALGKLERMKTSGPVSFAGLDNVQVPNKENGRARGLAPQ